MRRLKIGSLVFVGLLLAFSPFLSHPILANTKDVTSNSLNKEVLLVLVNENRINENLFELKENKMLTESAQKKAEDMAKKGYFSHISPEGLDAWHWFDTVGYNYRFAGENLAVNFTTPQRVLNAWMNSPTHKGNILNEKFSEIGTGVAYGSHKGKYTAFVVQHFGTLQVSPIAKEYPSRTIIQDRINNLFKRIEELRLSLAS